MRTAKTSASQPTSGSGYKPSDLIRDTLERCRSNGGSPDVLLVSTNFMTGLAIWGHAAQRIDAGVNVFGLVAEALDLLTPEVRPGVTTDALDKLVFEFAMDHGALPATLMYRGYGKSICTSINHVVCHGIPNEKPLREGDIVNIDLTLVVDGIDGRTHHVPGIDPARVKKVTEPCQLRQGG